MYVRMTLAHLDAHVHHVLTASSMLLFTTVGILSCAAEIGSVPPVAGLWLHAARSPHLPSKTSPIGLFAAITILAGTSRLPFTTGLTVFALYLFFVIEKI